MKIDTTAIEGYADMTPEQKLAALEGYEIADPDYSGYVKKETFDKTASELSKAKKDILAKMSEDERAQKERDEELQKLRDRNAELEKNAKIAAYKAQYLAMGYDDALATETAQAWADGNSDKVISNTAAFIAAHDKQVKAGMLGEMKTPPAGSGTSTLTKEQIMAVKDTAERQRLIAANPQLFQ
jgi:hypothetical protein